MEISNEIIKGHQLAIKARENAYAPYSQFKVGCAVKGKGIDEIQVGCNVENMAYPSSMCAERVGIYKFFPSYPDLELEWLILVTGSPQGDFPCGGCLQVIGQFSKDDLPIYVGNTDKILKKYMLKELRPLHFADPFVGE